MAMQLLSNVHDTIGEALPAPIKAVVGSVHDVVHDVYDALGQPSATKILGVTAVALGTMNYIKGNFLRPANVRLGCPLL